LPFVKINNDPRASRATFVCLNTSVVQAKEKSITNCIAMKGKQLFDHYQSVAQINGFGSEEFQYGNLLYQALKIEGEDKIFQLLEVAEKTGKRIALEYPVTSTQSYPEPDRVILI
jgi:hypothetical protein